MKITASLVLAAFAAAVLVTFTGCGVTITSSSLTGADGKVAYTGPIVDGQEISACGGHIEGTGAENSDVVLTPASEPPPKAGEMKECCAPTAIIGGVGGAVLVTAAGFALAPHKKFSYDISTVTEDTRITIRGVSFILRVGRCPSCPEGEGEPPVEYADVPDLSGMNLTQLIAVFTPSCLVLGTPVYAASATVPAGIVIGWTPTGHVPCGTRIVVTLSSGPPSSSDVAVPDLSGLNWSQSDVRLRAVGLVVGNITTVASSTVPIGIVADWSHRGGAVAPGTSIDLIVSTGPAASEGEGEPQTGVVPNLGGLTQSQATAVIGGTCLVVGSVTTATSSTVLAGYVIDWSPKGEVPCGTRVNLVISTGPANVTVPNLTGDNLSQAQAELAAVGLVTGTVTTESSANVPVGVIIRWSPTGAVAPGTMVNLVFSTGPGLVPVPDLTGKTEAEAELALLAVGLSKGVVVNDHSPTVPAGIVVSWNPTGSVAPGTMVNLVISTGPGTSVPLSVKITSPASGRVFHIGEVVEVSISFTGDSSKAPFKLIMGWAGKKLTTKAEFERMVAEKSVPTQVVQNAQPDRTYTFNVTVTMPGTAVFNAYVEQVDGAYSTDDVPYSVAQPVK